MRRLIAWAVAAMATAIAVPIGLYTLGLLLIVTLGQALFPPDVTAPGRASILGAFMVEKGLASHAGLSAQRRTITLVVSAEAPDWHASILGRLACELAYVPPGSLFGWTVAIWYPGAASPAYSCGMGNPYRVEPSEAHRAQVLINHLVEEGPPIRGSFNILLRVIYLVVEEGSPRGMADGMGEAACEAASALPRPYALPGWTIAVRYDGDPEPTYSCRIWDPAVPPTSPLAPQRVSAPSNGV